MGAYAAHLYRRGLRQVLLLLRLGEDCHVFALLHRPAEHNLTRGGPV